MPCPRSFTISRREPGMLRWRITDPPGPMKSRSPTIIITPTNVPTVHAATMNVTFQIQVTAPTGVGIQDATIDFGDGTVSDLGGLNGTVTIQHPYTSAGSKDVRVTVKDTLGRTTIGSTSITLP